MFLILFLYVSLLPASTLVHGHGNMVKPFAWWDTQKIGWWWDENEELTNVGCGNLDLPLTEYMELTGNPPDCPKMWFHGGSPGAKLPEDQEPTIPEPMSQPEVKCIGQQGENDPGKLATFPWSAPGATPIWSPCGTLGGNKDGCTGEEDETFGDCCGDSCGGFGLGDNAENYDWPDIPITEWMAGSYQEVAWYVDANHAGGYSYRLCKMPEGGISAVTEECFQQTPLDFVGDEQWVNYNQHKGYPGKRTKLTALQTNVGTFPVGSMWRANPLLPYREEGGSSNYGKGHVIDYVEVPEDLQHGEYVLSFR